MIAKERLKELIEQEATIYVIKTEMFIAGYSNYLKIEELELYSKCKVLEDFKLNINDSPNTYLLIQYCNGPVYYLLDKLYENKEDAEFTLRFKRIPRTEYLDLPTWEEFNNDNLTAFRTYPYNYHLLKIGKYIVIRNFYVQL